MLENNSRESELQLSNYLRTCPGLAGKIARHINDSLDTEQPGISLATALSFVAALKSGRITLGGLYPNVYALAIAPSGVGKSRAQHIISDICEKANLRDLLMGRPASDSGILKRLQQSPRQFLIWDEFGLAFSEMTQSTSSYRVAIVETLMDLFSSSGRLHLGKEYANQERIDVDKPALSICAASTPDRFYDALNKNFVTDGFLVRWLVFPGEANLVFKEPIKTEINFLDEIIYFDSGRPMKSGGNLQVNIVSECSEMKISSQIKKMVKEFFQGKSRSAKNSLEQAFWNRANEHTIKLCMILSDRDSVCDDNTAAYAWGLVTHLVEKLIAKCTLDMSNTRADKLAMERAEKFKNLIAPGTQMAKSELTREAGGRGYGRQEREWRIKDLLESGEWLCKEVKSSRTARMTTYFLRVANVYKTKTQISESLNDSTHSNDLTI